MEFSRDSVNELWYLKYVPFELNPNALYKLHPIIFEDGDDHPATGTIRLGFGNDIYDLKLGECVSSAELELRKSGIRAMLAGIVITANIKETNLFTASVRVVRDGSEKVKLQQGSFVKWLWGPEGSGITTRADSKKTVAINRIPEPDGYSERAGEIVACIATRVRSSHQIGRAHV